MKRKEKKNIFVVPSGITEGEFQMTDNADPLIEFDVQKTAESVNLYPTIAQGYPISGIKDIEREDPRR